MHFTGGAADNDPGRIDGQGASAGELYQVRGVGVGRVLRLSRKVFKVALESVEAATAFRNRDSEMRASKERVVAHERVESGALPRGDSVSPQPSSQVAGMFRAAALPKGECGELSFCQFPGDKTKSGPPPTARALDPPNLPVL